MRLHVTSAQCMHTGARAFVCVRRRGSSTSVAEVGNGAKAKRRASRSYDREGGREGWLVELKGEGEARKSCGAKKGGWTRM